MLNKIVDFEGPTNFGGDTCWIAIYNNNYPNQRTCLQLYIGIVGDNISYGLLRNLDKSQEREKNLLCVNQEKFDYNHMISYLEKFRQQIIDDNKPVKYWKFSPGEDAIFWNEMIDKKIASIGWGDFHYAGKSKSEIIKCNQNYFLDHPNDAATIQAFNSAEIGDILIAFKGRNTIIGYGVIKEKSKYGKEELIKNSGHFNYLYVDWIVLKKSIKIKKMVSMLTFYDLTERRMELDEIIDYDFDNLEYKRESEKINLSISFNKILYGPPGTGKTYKTILYSLNTIDGVENHDYQDNENYLIYKEKFDDFKSKRQIEFVTFHQSFSYEDFVEGIRAETKDGNISYAVKDGIFKKIAIEALFSKLEESEDNLDGKWNELKIKLNDKKNPPDTPFDQNNYEHKKLILKDQDLLTLTGGKPYVLIIDEINRGNTSRIFGELITLIESTKRAGQDEAMDVILPYSQERFTVPDNLYIIGTMNTADRSLALIDTALRRRFDFIEMMPQPELLKDIQIENIDIQEMLTTINNRIEALYDREHTIGHAFFMKLNDKSTLQDLAYIFKNNILPLLEEYFFEDWDKIIKVLGNSCIYTVIENVTFGQEFAGKTYRRNKDLDSILVDENTYLKIYQQKNTEPTQ